MKLNLFKKKAQLDEKVGAPSLVKTEHDYPPLSDPNVYLIDFDGPDDPLNPQNWKLSKKLSISGTVAFFAFVAVAASSIFAPAIRVVSQKYHISEEVGTLGTSLFVLGYCFGPVIWAPGSEVFGRRLPILVGTFGLSIFCVGAGAGKDIQTIVICRFFGGFCGSCPLVVVAAIYADMYNGRTRGLAIAVYAIVVAAGPFVAPFIGGFLVESDAGWRWTQYIIAIMGFVCLALELLIFEETYAPVILASKAARLRRETQIWAIHAPQDKTLFDLNEIVTKNLVRPLQMLVMEPIVTLVAIYMAFIYGLLYLLLTAYALVFQGVHAMTPGVGGLPFIAVIIGEVFAFVLIFTLNKQYVRKLQVNDSVAVPEWRLPLLFIAGPVFAAGFFWFGWTGFTSSIHWIVPTLAGLFVGFGIFGIFIGLTNYIVDSYLRYAASAVAALTFLRSLFGCVFPLFATYMFNNMGIQWASTLIGCVAIVMIPVPVLFYVFGRKIREKSRFAPAVDLPIGRTELKV